MPLSIASLERFHQDRMSGEYRSYEAEVSLANSAYKMKTYYEWIVEEKKEKIEAANWNQISFWKLITGRM